MNIIECENLTHFYGDKKIFEKLNFSVEKGKLVSLLGKNGAGKSTTINILMGFLKPSAGACKIFGQNIDQLSKEQKAKIGLLYEGHICYDYLSIAQIERLHAAHYGKAWKRDLYYELIAKMGIASNRRIATLSRGQRSQVVLGLIFAQDPEVLILDDYAMGLDIGYRRLFVEYLADFVKDRQKSVLMTTHMVSDLEHLIDDIIIIRRDSEPYRASLSEFMQNFKGYELDANADISQIKNIENVLELKNKKQIFGFFDDEISGGKRLDLSFEDAFLGFVGRY